MPMTIARKFRIADALVLIAATGAALAATRSVVPESALGGAAEALHAAMTGERPSRDTVRALGELTVLFIVPCLVAWSVALLALTVRPPRPPVGRLARRPGAIACLIVGGTTLVTAAMGPLIYRNNSPNLQGQERLLDTFEVCAAFELLQGGTAVFWAWVALALNRRWRPEASWIDRAGRLLGFAWVVLGTLALVIIIALP